MDNDLNDWDLIQAARKAAKEIEDKESEHGWDLVWFCILAGVGAIVLYLALSF